MHNEITVNPAHDATPAFTRRAVIMGAAAAIGAPAAMAAPQPADDVLAWLIDAHDELKAALCNIEDGIKALYGRADRPAWPDVKLSEIDTSLYAVNWYRTRLDSLNDIDRFFLEFPDMRWFDDKRAAVHSENHTKARSLFIERKAKTTAWNEATGLRALWDKQTELLEMMYPLDVQIVAFQCTTYGEVVAKVSWIEREFGDEISQEHAVRILRSLAGINAGAGGGLLMGQAIIHSRPPTYLSCASLARELDMSETTVRDFVEKGILPRPIKMSGGVVRWRWGDVQSALGGVAAAGATNTDDPYMVGAVHATSSPKS
ncbi:helix-turn-helix transcriptional regulator [Rhizobium herbae]|uniref:DNA-binding transcriptional regulator AlpA n=1 Tax=Rhizobium herbae TaxID=508661 RepID=A0ABS4EPP5_9HYPH|nr:hypothetical protein [Rhizobium herbae]MBP1859791.1 putative DNA-binding transcriptional regulator AlpA [Rhizobium herbae]